MAKYSETRPALRVNRIADAKPHLPQHSISDLAARAVARLREESAARETSSAACACMNSPVAIALATALCEDGSDTADLIVADLIEAGVSVEDVCIEHLAPAARCLGEWWDSDRLPFTEVTIAAARIQSILRRMPCCGARRGAKGLAAAFCAVPGEQHTLGVMMAADLFRRNGWDVSLLVGLDHGEVMSRLESEPRRVIGLSCSGAHSFPALARLMTALRDRLPRARLVLSGQIVADAAALSKLPAPDAVVTTMAEAEAQMARFEAESLVPQRPAMMASGQRRSQAACEA